MIVCYRNNIENKHGRLKVKTTEEQKKEKEKEREKKLNLYKAATTRIFEKRSNDELDKEMLNLTGELLSMNPDFSTLWNIRRELFMSWKEQQPKDDIQKILEEELYFLEQCLRINPKSYGTWHQRQFVLNTIPEPNWKRELSLCSKFLEFDDRNFHCWDYRRFVVARCNEPPTSELDFTTAKIKADFSNFSSWHYRSKLLPLIFPDPGQPTGVSEDALLKEFELVENAFFTDPNDQSGWFYHRWLLSKEQTTLAIKGVFLDRSCSRIIVILTKAAQFAQDYSLTLCINGEKSSVNWSSPSAKYSTMITADLGDLLQQSNTDYAIALSLDETSDSEVVLQLDRNSSYLWKPFTKSRKLFSQDLSASTLNILDLQVKSIKELHQLEPDNKWVIHAILLLMRAIDPVQYEQDTIEYIDKLTTLDPTRRHYYADLRSRFLVEDTIEKLENDSRSINLAGRALTSMYHTDLLAGMKFVDLSSNGLTSLKNAFNLQSVKLLNLNHNKLKDCKDIRNLPQLKILDLQNNDIESVRDLLPLSSCEKLHTLMLSNNPVTKTHNFQRDMKDKFPNIENLIV